MITITNFFVAITCLISILAFNNREMFAKLQFNPYQVYHRKEYFRLLSHGFIHADWMHLIVNMFVLYSFGNVVESYFKQLEAMGVIHFPILYFTFLYLAAIVIASLTTLIKYKDNIMYNSVGASGGVSAILFCSIFFAPYNPIGLYFVIKIPGIIFGILYLVYSQYMSKKNVDNVNHDAHFIGAVFGFIFPLIIKFSLIHVFIDQLFSH